MGRGQWCKLTDLQECDRLMKYKKVVAESSAAERLINRHSVPVLHNSEQMQQEIESAQIYFSFFFLMWSESFFAPATRKIMREERKRRRQQMDHLREKLDEARRKVARLETRQQQNVRYLNAHCDLLELLTLRI
jgi:uncharacterized protein YlxW (UPF0749 family)